jgi:DNA processing protein
MDEAHLALALVPGIGPVRFAALVERFGSAAGALAAPVEFLGAVEGISAAVADGIASASRKEAARALEQLAGLGGVMLGCDQPGYPALLRVLDDAPACLFALGRLELLDHPAVAIVGSRSHTRYGADVCLELGKAAAAAGLVVVSGMARGLDALAHTGALDANGGTIGVLGHGLGRVYPPGNRPLFDRVIEHGLLLTEYPPYLPPGPGSFPRRNRLISGLARVTVVVEAKKKSGALQTVGWAQTQGREVMAVPGPITSPVSEGTNGLIREGAAPLLELDDLLTHYPEIHRPRAAPAATGSSDLSPVENSILNALWAGSQRLEDLVEASGAPVADALDAVSALELAGRIRQRAGGWYQLSVSRLFS